MKVLWFSNSPSRASSLLDNHHVIGTSWIESIESGISNFTDIELGVAFPWAVEHLKELPSENKRNRYFMIPKKRKGKWNRLIRRHFLAGPGRPYHKPILELIESFKPDLIHFFGTETYFPTVIPLLNIPSVIWFQGNLTVYQTKWQTSFPIWSTLRYESLINLAKASTLFHNYHHYKHLVNREKDIFKTKTNFIGRTDWDRRLVSIMSPDSRYFHCEELMREQFNEKAWSFHSNRNQFTVLTTIRPNLYKGLETAMAAYRLVRERISGLQWRIVGVDKVSTYAKACYDRSALSPDDEGFKLLGSKSADDLANELINSDLYVHPSHIDNSPNSVCEAMLMGVPVLATNVGGIPSLIENDVDGILIQSGDPYAMAGAILELYKHEAVRKKLSANGRRRGLKRNNPENVSLRLQEIYTKLLS